MSLRRLSLLTICAACALVAGALALNHAQPQNPVDSTTPAVGGKGLRVAMDPETGDLVPVKTQAEKGVADLSRSHEGLVQVIHPDGSASVDLQGRFQCQATATVAEDGTVQVHYAHGAQAQTAASQSIEE